ncbi:conserved Plasmodium protein, unknown function [Plasmodium sp. DRC-Itaito]|nr:conserved Plasmodium protein, unknown function [Plasmodium sp. DRC-Itaito]
MIFLYFPFVLLLCTLLINISKCKYIIFNQDKYLRNSPFAYHSNSLFKVRKYFHNFILSNNYISKKKSKQYKGFNHELNKENELKGEEDPYFFFSENILDKEEGSLPFDKEKIMASIKKQKKQDDNIKNILKKTKKHCNYLTNKLGRLNKKLREIKKLETVFYANPNILTEEQKVKLSKKDQVKNEIVIINRYRKKYISYKRNLQKNVDDTSPFFYNKKKKKEKKKFCTPEEFREILKSNDPKGTIQKIKKIDLNKIPKNVTDFLVFNKVGTKEEIKILFGLKAIKINGNTIDDENYILNIKEDEVKVFDQIVHIHEDHYAIRKRFTTKQKQILNKKKKETINEAKKEVKEVEKFFGINL